MVGASRAPCADRQVTSLARGGRWSRCLPSGASACRPRRCTGLVTGIPERLSLLVLAALCDILECTPAELIATRATNAAPRKTGTGDAVAAAAAGLPDDLRPRRARRRPPGPAAPTAPRGVSCAAAAARGGCPPADGARAAPSPTSSPLGSWA
jgi:Cro/C1-type HTH DNA-binding domain